jgi:hypothetical protein
MQIPNTPLKRCYISEYNATRSLLEDFVLSPNVGQSKGVDVPLLFSYFAMNETTGSAEGIVEFEKQVYSNAVYTRLEELGFTSIDIMTFQHNDGNHSAASALNRVCGVVQKPGFHEVASGKCNPKLLAKADELLEAEQGAPSGTNGDGDGKNSEFDAKTAAALKQSMTDIHNESVGIKTTVDNIEVRILKEQDDLIKNHHLTVRALNKSIVARDQTILDQQQTVLDQQGNITELQESNRKLQESNRKMQKTIEHLKEEQGRSNKHIDSQAFVLAKLNKQKDESTTKIQTLQESLLRRATTGDGAGSKRPRS